MQYGQMPLSGAPAAWTGPVYTQPRSCPQHTQGASEGVTEPVATGFGWYGNWGRAGRWRGSGCGEIRSWIALPVSRGRQHDRFRAEGLREVSPVGLAREDHR